MRNLALDFILLWDSEEARQKIIFTGDRQQARWYLQAVDVIQRSDDQSTIPIAMARLENEFRNILISYTNPTSSLDPLNTEEEEKEAQNSFGCFRHFRFNGSAKQHDAAAAADDDKLPHIGVIPYDAIKDLRCIAERMISSGYLGNCIHVYSRVRKSVFVATVQRLVISDVKLRLKAKIQRWREASTVYVRTLFANEKELCEKIFDEVGPEIDRACFMETVKEPAIQLLKYADATCMSPISSPDILFKILVLYEALADFDRVFDFKSSESIRVMVAEVLPRLAEAGRRALYLFECSVVWDKFTVVIPSGAIHPFTTYVMNYLNFFSDYKQTLNKFIVPKPSMESFFADIKEEGETPLRVHIIWIFEELQVKLQGKSKQYKDESLSHLFIMNNVHYTHKRVRRNSKLRDIIGDGRLKELERKLTQAAISHEKATWGRVLDCLTDEGLYLEKGDKISISKSALRKKN
ncbi:exocyst complex component EXO70B1-like [Abrus precatorius]|uniref:Exocyst subunit Exo70 family protein n=1 Tax=Abrus precatorius TaxID=3816 RepID=A0A8B8KQ47_ABRPR|nr:exocyst complex component EXO70B1-like [Abrus precatorius]